jgi:fumarylpyruvate hydrolase
MPKPTYVLELDERPSVAVVATEARFAVHRIYCVGRNYAAHAREMGIDPAREPPFFFGKPPDAVVADGAPVPYPPGTKDFQHEAELVVAVGTRARDLEPEEALEVVYGYAVGNDLTRRDLQALAKDRRQPWDVSKGFDRSAPISAICPVSAGGHVEAGAITLAVNGVERQRADLSEMIWSVPELLARLSQLFELQPGDLVYTGTPAGVGPVRRGDVMEVAIEGLGTLRNRVV